MTLGMVEATVELTVIQKDVQHECLVCSPRLEWPTVLQE